MAWSPKFTFSVTWDNVSDKPATATRWPTWGEVTGKPSTFAPSSHTHTIANVTGLQAALDNKADDSGVVKTSGAQTVSGTKTFRGLAVNSLSEDSYINFGGGVRRIGADSESFYIGVTTSQKWASFSAAGTTLTGPVVSTSSFEAPWINCRAFGPSSTSSSTTCQLFAANNTISLRPKGQNEVGNQTTIASNGNMSVGGNISASGTVSDSAGNLRTSMVTTSGDQTGLAGNKTWTGTHTFAGVTSPNVTAPSTILLLTTSSTSGTIRLRPRGSNQSTGQMELASSGTLTSRNGYYYSYSGEIRLGSASNYIEMNTNGAVFTPGRISANVDNTYPCGGAGFRWTVMYATTGSINTSDAREKQDFRELTEQELQCGLQLARDAQIYKWKHAVEEKGEGARLHCSPTVQQVIATMESFELDPFRYGFVCYDEWDAEPDEVDEEGQVTKKGSPAGNRYSLRPDELRAFVDAAVVARQDLIEARLAALEAHE